MAMGIACRGDFVKVEALREGKRLFIDFHVESRNTGLLQRDIIEVSLVSMLYLYFPLL